MIKKKLPLQNEYVANIPMVVEGFLSAFKTCFARQRVDFGASYSVWKKSGKLLVEFAKQNIGTEFGKRLKNEFVAHLDLWGDIELYALKSFVEHYFSENKDCFEGAFFVHRDRILQDQI